MLDPDAVLQSRYRIVRQLGRGGMGAVYEATDQRLSRTVALKETFAYTDELRHAFEREARLLANLNHPSLPRVLDHFNEGDGQYLVMDYVPGSDLKTLLEQQSHAFHLSDVLRWADELLDALEYLHSNEPPIIHRDIKPSNLKLNSKGRIVLLDFGLAKGTAGLMKAGTLSKSVLGYSPHYAPLEQIQGEKTTPRSDLYALASTLYDLLTGQEPTDALTRATAMLDDEPDPLRALSSVNAEIPPRTACVIMGALALKPSQRPASASEMRASLIDAYKMVSASADGDDEVTVVRMPPLKVGSFSAKSYPEEEARLPRTGGHAALSEQVAPGGKKGVFVACVLLLVGLGFVGVMVLTRLSRSSDQNIVRSRTEPTPTAPEVPNQNENETSPNGLRSSSAASPGPQESTNPDTNGNGKTTDADAGSASSKGLGTMVKLKSAPPKELVQGLWATLSSSQSFDGSISKLAKAMTVYSVDLDGDGGPEFIVSVSGMCGASGANCEEWVYRKRAEAYELMLDDTYIEPMKTITNGYRDLKASGTSGAYDLFFRFYKFDGKHYRNVKCTERWYDDEQKRWTTKTIKCN
jgi:serine/threonine protein kinase